jgi:hypothetical protein
MSIATSMTRIATIALAATAIAGAAHAQNPFEDSLIPEGHVWPANAPEVSYAALDALPDWRGIWLPAGRPELPGEPPLKGEYLERYQAALADAGGGEIVERASNCVPPGMPSVMYQPYNIQFLFTPGKITILQEAYMQVRYIFTDGRPLPVDPDPWFNGHSVGHWEDGTLVVETVGVKDTTRLAVRGATHSDQLKITERMHLDPEDPDRLLVTTIFEDPLALSEPWVTEYAYTRRRDWEQIEFICAENDRNPIGDDGLTLFIHE